ncbi:MAG: hypothetical protein ABIH70_05085 [Chloroflexota bacterium]
MNSNGSDLKRLTQENPSATNPKWSPDGTRIAYQANDNGVTYLCVVNTDGSSPKRIIGINGDFDWSPDGSRIAVSSTMGVWSPGNLAEVCLIDANGNNIQRLTEDSTWDGNPRWSPDGTKIAFASLRDGHSEIYVMNNDGTSLRQLTDLELGFDYPSWSPNGNRIAFLSYTTGIIYIVDADGSSLTKLNIAGYFVRDFSWSPDSASMVISASPRVKFDYFTSDSDIYFINVDGTGLRQLTFDHLSGAVLWIHKTVPEQNR